MPIYARPNSDGAKVNFKSRYGNYIGGEWVPPVKGQYFENISPVTGKPFCEIPRSTAEDIDKALDAAHAAKVAWGKTSPTERSNILNKIADVMEQNLELLAVAETWDNGKPVRETMAADMPLAIDHFRYFAGCIRAQEGGLSQLDSNTVAYHFKEPIGVVGQIIPWNFPILMAVWKLAPALAAGNCVVLKPAEQTPASILVLFELIGHLLPRGVVNIVNGFGVEAGKPLASSNRIGKIAFTGETTTGRLIMQYASENLIPVTLELGGKSPNIFFEDVLDKDDDFRQKCLEGFAFFALNQGEVCTCPSRALIAKKIYPAFLEMAIERTKLIKPGNPLDTATNLGAQASNDQLEKILSYFAIGKSEGAKILTGGERVVLEGDLAGGYYVTPTIFEGNNKMRVFQEEIFGPVVSVTSFEDFDDAIKIANDSLYGLGAGVWSRSTHTAYRAGRAIEAGRVWTNCYHHYPAHAAFGGYKQSGIGRENHLMMLSHYQQTKNLLVSYDEKPMGFFLSPQRPRHAPLPRRRHPGRHCPHRAHEGPPRPARVPPVGGLLRWQRPDVLPPERVQDRPVRRLPRGDRRLRGLHRRPAVRALAAHPPRHRRRPGARRGLLRRVARGHALSHPLPGLHARGAGRTRRRPPAPPRPGLTPPAMAGILGG
jgi:aldehyde dehydrogenase